MCSLDFRIATGTRSLLSTVCCFVRSQPEFVNCLIVCVDCATVLPKLVPFLELQGCREDVCTEIVKSMPVRLYVCLYSCVRACVCVCVCVHLFRVVCKYTTHVVGCYLEMHEDIQHVQQIGFVSPVVRLGCYDKKLTG
jgi:hypothetical protein